MLTAYQQSWMLKIKNSKQPDIKKMVEKIFFVTFRTRKTLLGKKKALGSKTLLWLNNERRKIYQEIIRFSYMCSSYLRQRA